MKHFLLLIMLLPLLAYPRLPPYLNLIFAIQVSLVTIFVKHAFLTMIQYKLDKESLVFKFTKTYLKSFKKNSILQFGNKSKFLKQVNKLFIVK